MKQEYTYDEQDKQIFSTMASQAAIALDNTSLYAATRQELIATKQVATLGTAMTTLQHSINITGCAPAVLTSDRTVQ